MTRSLSNNIIASTSGGGGGGDDHTDTPHDLSDITGISTLVHRNADVSIDGDISVTSGHGYKIDDIALQSTDLFDSASLVRTTATDLTISGTLGANKCNLTGLVPQFQINGTQISSANLSDASDLATTSALSDYVDLNSAQAISGKKTFQSATNFHGGVLNLNNSFEINTHQVALGTVVWWNSMGPKRRTVQLRIA